MSTEEHFADPAPGPKIEFTAKKFQIEVERPVAEFEIDDRQVQNLVTHHARQLLPDETLARVQKIDVSPLVDPDGPTFEGFRVVVTLKEGS